MAPINSSILRDIDVEQFKRLVGCTSDEVALLAIHKCRTVFTHLPAADRLSSVEWLRERGYSGWKGQPLPPVGQLP